MSIQQIAGEFDRCRTWIEAALEYAAGTHRLEHVREAVLRGELQLWPGENSVIVTEIEHYPLKKVLHFFLAGGNLAELEKMTPAIEAWGKSMGCSAVTLTGRAGWQRTFLQYHGYKARWTVMAKEL